jgi:UTP--glucose-1-phosphate uridylyltransferase
VDAPLDFLQHQEPRLRADDLRPLDWPQRRELEWCPPGHGDLYLAMATSGMLDRLLEGGYRYAFISNADNLGAVLHPGILSWFAATGSPFAMEVVAGTEADRKGGHIARRADGGLVLRETAQTSPDDLASFRNFRRWRHYNTNNLWLDLRALDALLERQQGVLDLPLIVNRKTADPADADTPAVIQLETAMGAAIALFADARAIRVPRNRFIPVKTTDDLLVLRSDIYAIGDDAVLTPRAPAPVVDLDPQHYRRIDDFDHRFPHGAPSLLSCDRLVVRGDVTFGAGVVARGAVELTAEHGTQRHVEGSLA